MILVDTNLLLDVVTDDPVWAQWSIAQLESAAIEGSVLVNDVVNAELSALYDSIEQLDAFVAKAERAHVGMPMSACRGPHRFWPRRCSRDTGGLAVSVAA